MKHFILSTPAGCALLLGENPNQVIDFFFPHVAGKSYGPEGHQRIYRRDDLKAHEASASELAAWRSIEPRNLPKTTFALSEVAHAISTIPPTHELAARLTDNQPQTRTRISP